MGDQGRNLTFNELRPLDTTSNAISDCLQRIESKFDALVKGQDRLLQSHAALADQLKYVAADALITNQRTLRMKLQLDGLDARLKGTGDGRFDGQQKEEDVWRSHLLDRLPKLPKRKRK